MSAEIRTPETGPADGYPTSAGTPAGMSSIVSESRIAAGSQAGAQGGIPAGPGTLFYAIERWQAAHPDFVAITECVRPSERVTPVPPPDPYTAYATKIGVTAETYRAHREAGERWCSWHHEFHDPKAVAYSGLASMCVEGWRLYQRKRRAG